MPLTFRLYLCSHVTDTKAERDHLHAVVFPELRRRLARSGCQLEVMDLRHALTSEEDAEGAAGLADAFRKIGECRPWFLALVGDRVGPALTSLPDELLAAHVGLREMLPASRMELELWKGVLREDRPAAGLIYVRDGEATDAAARARLAWLRRGEAEERAIVRTYSLTSASGSTSERLRAFGDAVLMDLSVSMEAVYRTVLLESVQERGALDTRAPEPGEPMALTARIIQRTLAGRDLVVAPSVTPAPSPAVAPAPIPEVPEYIGGYRILRRLGAGGFGAVYEAEDETGRRVAIKLVESGSRAVPLPSPPAKPVYVDENVQFTVYRPRVVAPEKWYPLLAFAHLSERPPDAAPGTPDPVEEVYRQARHILGAAAKDYQDVTQDSHVGVPREGELTLVPEIPGVQFNPPRRSFLWTEPVHREEFRLKANADLDGKTVRGRLTVYLGSIILADVSLALRVDSSHRPAGEEVEADKARPYRKIFASYSHRDAHVVQQVEHLARVFGDRYLRDWSELRAGEVWDERLTEMIRQADVFQLFWSRNSMASPHCRREWEYALALGRPYFVRPTYWEEPLPTSADGSLPPEELRRLHFQKIFTEALTHPLLQPAGAVATVSASVKEWAETAAPATRGGDDSRRWRHDVDDEELDEAEEPTAEEKPRKRKLPPPPAPPPPACSEVRAPAPAAKPVPPREPEPPIVPTVARPRSVPPDWQSRDEPAGAKSPHSFGWLWLLLLSVLVALGVFIAWYVFGR